MTPSQPSAKLGGLGGLLRYPRMVRLRNQLSTVVRHTPPVMTVRSALGCQPESSGLAFFGMTLANPAIL